MRRLHDSGALLRLAVEALESYGVDREVILKRVGVTAEQLEDESLRTPHEAQARFWNALHKESGDDDVGLHLSEKTPTYQGNVLEYLFLSSSTFGAGLRRAVRYQRLLSDASVATMGTDDYGSYLSFGFEPSIGHRHINESTAMGLFKFFAVVTDGEFAAKRIDFVHAKPAVTSEHDRLFPCPVIFGCKENRVYFKPGVMQLESNHAEPELLRLHEKAASSKVAQLASQDVIPDVEQVIAEVLEEGGANLEVIADRLNATPRELRSRLNNAGTNFNQVLADYRCKLAKRLLANTDESINQIVYLTGFSEPSTFYRAFKRWVGMTPVDYRQRKKAEREARHKKLAAK